MPLQLPKLIVEKARLLEQAGIECSRVEVELILCHLLDVDRLNLYLHGENLITDKILSRFDQILKRRATRHPLQFILGEAWFYGRTFLVNEAVMAPTPETELLCESAIRFVRESGLESPKILDLGVGSGVISVTLACELEYADILAVDISPQALEIARKNAKLMEVGGKIDFRQSDLFSSLTTEETFDLILSNPPYISEEDYPDLPPEVLADPKVAMVSGSEGLDHIRRILDEAPDYLVEGGLLAFEMGFDHADKVTKITERDSRYISLTIVQDLNDIPRIAMLRCSS
jgi:release factor glutamine methyltransferase